METYKINILNPKATKLLKYLADLDLISIKKTSEDSFENILNRLRKKAASETLSIEDITKEVESVRFKRYEAKKG